MKNNTKDFDFIDNNIACYAVFYAVAVVFCSAFMSSLYTAIGGVPMATEYLLSSFSMPSLLAEVIMVAVTLTAIPFVLYAHYKVAGFIINQLMGLIIVKK